MLPDSMKAKSSSLRLKIKNFFQTNSFYYGVGHVSYLLARLVRDALLARTVSNQTFSLWAGFNILRQYGNYSDLGLFNGLAREIPRVKNNITTTQNYIGTAIWGALLTTVMVVVWLYFFNQQDSLRQQMTSLTFLFMLLFIAWEKVYKFFNAILLGFDLTKKSGLFLFLLSILDLLFAVGGSLLHGFNGLLWGTTLAVVVTSVCMYFYKPIDILVRFDKPSAKSLFSSSLLLMCFGLLNVALKNADRTMYIYLNGDQSILGSHHAASLVAMAVGIIPFIFISVINPTIYSLASTSYDHFVSLLRKYGSMCSLSACVVGIILSYLARFIVPLIFPQQPYVLSILPYLICIEILLASSLVIDSILVVKNKGLAVLIFKFCILVISIVTQGFILRQQGAEHSLPTAQRLAFTLMCVHLVCFSGSFLYLLRLLKKKVPISDMGLILAWPVAVAASLCIILR